MPAKTKMPSFFEDDDNVLPLGPKKMLTLVEVCEIVSLGRSLIYREITEGRLRSVKIGSARRVRVSDLDEWLESLPAS